MKIYLLDTNVWLEELLGQEKRQEVEDFFNRTDPQLIYLTDFSLYSIGISLSHLKKFDLYEDFLSDTILDSGVKKISLDILDLKRVLAHQRKFNLDFDDAYQYTAAEKYDLTLISFDADFDRTERGRKTPGQI
jgi:predicted nucleic acid-binding protein